MKIGPYLMLFLILALPTPCRGDDFSRWLQHQYQISRRNLLKNISPTGAADGAVIASPSSKKPNYVYHWVRDAALVMDPVLWMYKNAKEPNARSKYLKILKDYVSFARQNQNTPTQTGLGEPKFHIDGSAFNEPWGRPQNDSPALRAITLIGFAEQLLKEGKKKWVQNHLYDGRLPSQTVIKKDLEYVAHHWNQSGFDLWEEVNGDHFYTRLVQRRALLEGARLARILNDPKAATFYLEQGKSLEKVIDDHWDSTREIIQPNFPVNGNYRPSSLDASVVLGSLHAIKSDDLYYSPANSKILSTAQKIQEAFHNLYEVNKNAPQLGTAIGRYPEDHYDGNENRYGNPWVLTTLGFAELHYRTAKIFKTKRKIPIHKRSIPFLNSLLNRDERNILHQLHRSNGEIRERNPMFKKVTDALIQSGDRYMKRIRHHVGADGSLSEQIDRKSGEMKSASDLTWSYASFVTAIRARLTATRER